MKRGWRIAVVCLLSGMGFAGCSEPNDWQKDLETIGVRAENRAVVAAYLQALKAKFINLHAYYQYGSQLSVRIRDARRLEGRSEQDLQVALTRLAKVLVNSLESNSKVEEVLIQVEEKDQPTRYLNWDAGELLDPENRTFTQRDGYELYESGLEILATDTARALELFLMGVEADPEFSGNYVQLVQIYIAQGDFAGAEEWVYQAHDYIRADVEVFLSEVRLALAMNEVTWASGALDSVAVYNKYHEEYFVLRAICLAAQGDSLQACSFLASARELQSRGLGDLEEALGPYCDEKTR